MTRILIDTDTWLEVSNLCDETFAPLTGFLGSTEYQAVLNEGRLPTKEVWPIPISLDVPAEFQDQIAVGEQLELCNEHDQVVATLEVSEVFLIDQQETAEKLFGTADMSHPGVAKEMSRSVVRVAGVPTLLQEIPPLFPELCFTPAQTRELFQTKGWSTVVGFQTRNPPHRAHEYLQRIGMELCDGIFLQPLIGWKKPDDFSPSAVIEGYRALVSQFYPDEHVLLGTLRTPMRYAGPREAVFHALIRRNHGCTHFIVGRDHAGVGDFYGKYEAQEYCLGFPDLGIEILPLKGPFFCAESGCIVTEKTSRHRPQPQHQVSGTRMREMLSSGQRPPEDFMRPEISDVLISLAQEHKLFVGNGDGL